MKRTMKTLALAMALAMTVGMMTGCGNKDDSDAEEGTSGTGLTGSVTVAGSTSVQPLSEELAAVFMEKEGGVTVEIQGGGSGVGIKSINDGIANIGALSRELKDEEKTGVKEYVIAKDGVAVIINSDTAVDNLSLEQIQKIFTGEITNWKDVGGDDQEILVVSREEGSGTRGAFVEITGVEAADPATGEKVDRTTINALVQGSTGSVKQTVSSTPNTIGYISIGALDDSVKTVKVDDIEASEDNVKNETYKISRPFLYVTKGEVDAATQAYIDFILSDEGQAIVAEDFIPIN